MRNFIIILVLNIVVLLLLYFLSYLIGFLIGFGSADYSRYQVYVTGTLVFLQTSILLYYFFKNISVKEIFLDKYQFLLIAIIIFLLSTIGRYFIEKIFKIIF